MPEDPPGETRPSFWSTLPGVFTGLAAAVGAVGTLITALYSAGVIGRVKPEAKPPEVVTPTPTPQVHPEFEETKNKLEEAERQRQIAEQARIRAEAEAARLKSEQAAVAAKELEARKQAELEAAKKRAEEAEAARAKVEAEIERLKNEQAAAARARDASLQQGATARLDTKASPRRFRDAILGYRVVRIWQTEVIIDVDYTFDRSSGGPMIAGATLFYQGKPISAYKLSPVTQEKGTARVQLIVRTTLGRQSDELEIFLRRDKEGVASRKFPFARRFEDARPRDPMGSTGR